MSILFPLLPALPVCRSLICLAFRTGVVDWTVSLLGEPSRHLLFSTRFSLLFTARLCTLQSKSKSQFETSLYPFQLTYLKYQNKGFNYGFIEFDDPGAAERAMANLNGRRVHQSVSCD